MAVDSRLINPDKVVELLKKKLNSNRLSISYVTSIPPDNSHRVYFFDVYPWGMFVNYTFEYDDSEMKIKEMNKILKRKNDGKGITTEELIANQIYSEFMAKWISYVKIPKTIEEEKEEKAED